MRRSLFLLIMHKLNETSPYFTERFDVICHCGLTPLQNCIAAIWLLSYVMTAYMIDEYLKLGKTISLECLEKYCEGIIDCYGMSSYVGLLLSFRMSSWCVVTFSWCVAT
jgi:hypothetical protein